MTMSELLESAHSFYLYYTLASVLFSILVGLFRHSKTMSFLMGLSFGNSLAILISTAIDPFGTSVILLFGGIISFVLSLNWIHAHIVYPPGKLKESNDLSADDIL